MLKRSAIASKAKSIFFEGYNDIDIYIEDTAYGYKKLYTKLLSRYFENEYRIEDVFPLGGREAVIDACVNDKNKRLRPRVYIIDGDLYLLRNNIPNIDGLFVLTEYCIENTLVCENASIEFLVDEDPTRDYQEINTALEFSKWIEHNENHLINLFTIYALSMEMTPELPTVSLKVNEFINDDTGLVDLNKINSRIEERRNQIISRVGRPAFEQKSNQIKSIIDVNAHKMKFISGKDYLLPLLQMRMRKVVKFTSTSISFRHRLSNCCRLDVFEGLKNKVLIN
jgi:hypothetical protein